MRAQPCGLSDPRYTFPARDNQPMMLHRSTLAIITAALKRLAILLSLLPQTLGLSGCSRPSPAQELPPPTAVQIAAVEAVPIRDTSEYIATLKSRRSIVLQPQIDGQVTRIFVASGDAVKQGDPIMQIDPARQEALVSSEQASRNSKIAALHYWQQQVQRLA